jgi:hypothetical protein
LGVEASTVDASSLCPAEQTAQPGDPSRLGGLGRHKTRRQRPPPVLLRVLEIRAIREIGDRFARAVATQLHFRAPTRRGSAARSPWTPHGRGFFSRLTELAGEVIFPATFDNERSPDDLDVRVRFSSPA